MHANWWDFSIEQIRLVNVHKLIERLVPHLNYSRVTSHLFLPFLPFFFFFFFGNGFTIRNSP